MRRESAAGLGAASLAMAASGPGQSFGLAVFTDPLMTSADVGRTTFSALYAVATVCSAAFAFRAGQMLDRLSTAAVWAIAVAGLAGALLGLSAGAGPFALLPALCAARACGQGVLPLLGTVVVARGFAHRRGEAMAVAAQGLTLTGLLLPVIAVALSERLGWQVALRLIAALLALVVLPLGLLLLARCSARASRPVRTSAPTPRVLRRPGVPLLAATLAVPPLVTTALVVHATAIGSRAGVSAAIAATAVGLVSAGSAAGVIAGGWLGRRASAAGLLSAIASCVAIGSLGVLTGGPLVLAGYTCCGIAGGLVSSANATLWAGAYGLADLGSLQGTATAAQISGAALGPLVPAISLSLTGSFDWGLVVLEDSASQR